MTRLFVGHGLRLAAIGVAFGLAAAIAVDAADVVAALRRQRRPIRSPTPPSALGLAAARRWPATSPRARRRRWIRFMRCGPSDAAAKASRNLVRLLLTLDRGRHTVCRCGAPGPIVNPNASPTDHRRLAPAEWSGHEPEEIVGGQPPRRWCLRRLHSRRTQRRRWPLELELERAVEPSRRTARCVRRSSRRRRRQTAASAWRCGA